MPGYKLYFLDAEGHITHARDLECEDDEHALRVADHHPGPHGRELWQQARCVAVLGPGNSSD